jgi:8-amino-3,8-dideoxy-alpha-D-manno-octulosonate transaminase
MPGWELINHKEKSALNNLFTKNRGILFAHGYDKIRNKYHVREFEKSIAHKFKSKHVLAVSSGTAAIKIALKAIGIKPGDEVLTQAFNFIATVEAILDAGAKPIIVGVDETLNMCPLDLKKKISRKTKAIIPVHMLGVPANLKKILKISKKKKIKVISDNCESMGAKINNKFINQFVDIEIFSLDFGKTITCGEGGLILTDNDKIAKYCREYHDHGHENKITPRGIDTVSIAGFNYRMTEMQAAIGKEQLKKFNFILKENKKRYEILNKTLKQYGKIRRIPNQSSPIYDTFIFEPKKNKNIVIKYLNNSGIGTKNLPDAIRWHCAHFWKHALDQKNIKNSFLTKKKLQKQIAIPILLKQSLSKYNTVAKKIAYLLA